MIVCMCVYVCENYTRVNGCVDVYKCVHICIIVKEGRERRCDEGGREKGGNE